MAIAFTSPFFSTAAISSPMPAETSMRPTPAARLLPHQFRPIARADSQARRARERALSQRNEIASHGVGHFNGAAWSVGDWEKEFHAFGDILKNVGRNNRLSGSHFAFAATDVIGFRAPYLAKGAGLYGALKAHG